jgi:hypothetical protein
MDIVRPSLNWKVNTNGNPRGYLHVLILRARSEVRDRSRVSKGRYRMCCLPQILMRNKRDVVLWQLLSCTNIFITSNQFGANTTATKRMFRYLPYLPYLLAPCLPRLRPSSGPKCIEACVGCHNMRFNWHIRNLDALWGEQGKQRTQRASIGQAEQGTVL